MRLHQTLVSIGIVLFVVTGCAEVGSYPSVTNDAAQIETRSPSLSDDAACESLYGAQLEGPEVRGVDIVKRFERDPSLLTVTAEEVQTALDALRAIEDRTQDPLSGLIATNAGTLGQILEVLRTRMNQSIDTAVFKESGQELLRLCAPFLS